MADSFTDLLSDYLDGEDLSIDERHRIAAHLAGCGECRATLEELREVAAHAATLPDSGPDADLWPGIAARIAAGTHAATPFRSAPAAVRRISFTVPQLVAAGLALMLLSGGTVWLARLGGSRTDFEPLSAQISDRAPGPVRAARTSDLEFDEAIADLERTLEAGRSRLSPETVRVLETNLQAVDRAIAECRAALADDPSSVYLNAHLASTERRKLMMLRRAAALAAPQS
jgi:hypothetical protein